MPACTCYPCTSVLMNLCPHPQQCQQGPNTAPGTSVQAAHGIARVHDENKNIVFLLLKIVKFVKYFFDLIIYIINTPNEWAIFDWKHILCSSADRRKCWRLLRAAFRYGTLRGINCNGWFAKNALSIYSHFPLKRRKSSLGSSCSL